LARRRSLSLPIILGSTAVPLAAALLVGWTLLLAKTIAESDDVVGAVWLLVLGAISFAVILASLGLLTAFLVREILEVRRQDGFIDSVTHELKSPLASLKLCLETLEREGVEPAQRDDLHHMMCEDVERLNAFIDDVLETSRATAKHGSRGMHVEPLDVRDLLTECAANLERRHARFTGQIEVEVESGLRIATDRAALEVVLKNLLDNAAKYSEGDLHIVMRAAPAAGSSLVIEVVDRGIGIPEKERKRVFQRFYRENREDVRRRKGTGLGLFVVSSLVKHLGGKVEARAGDNGVGTIMRVTLPRQVD